jgi:hypothetical protein
LNTDVPPRSPKSLAMLRLLRIALRTAGVLSYRPPVKGSMNFPSAAL